LSNDEYGYSVAVRQALAACGLIVVLWMVGAAAGAGTRPQRVTVIADSVFGEVVGNRDSRAILSAGFEMKIDVGICRRLTGTSCSYQGVEPPTLIDVVHSLGSGIAPTVMVEVGYNDLAETFPQAVEEAIDGLLAAGVTRILWVTMAEGRSQYVAMNGMLGAVAGRHPEVRLVDWANASRSHESWFLGDGVHLTYDGALEMARLLHSSLVDALVSPLVVPKPRLPIAHPGQRYRARLTARGGVAPYRWRVTSGKLAAGFHLLPGGEITGIPRRSMKMPLSLRVTDAAGQTTTVKTTITTAPN